MGIMSMDYLLDFKGILPYSKESIPQGGKRLVTDICKDFNGIQHFIDRIYNKQGKMAAH
jgi:hypothetical protein